MKRNFKLKKQQTMLEVLCEYLIAFKMNVDERGVIYPSSSGEKTKTQSTLQSEAVETTKLPAKPIQMARPMTSGGPQGRMSKAMPAANNLMAKPAPMMNAFSSGSKADLSQANPIELAPGALNK